MVCTIYLCQYRGWFIVGVYPPYCILFVFDSSVHFMLAGFKTPPTSSFPKAGLRDPPVTFGTQLWPKLGTIQIAIFSHLCRNEKYQSWPAMTPKHHWFHPKAPSRVRPSPSKCPSKCQQWKWPMPFFGAMYCSGIFTMWIHGIIMDN